MTNYIYKSKITVSIIYTLSPAAAHRANKPHKKMYSIKNGVTGKYFYGNKISDYGIEHGRVDYSTLAKSFDCVLNNTIYNVGWDFDEWEQLSGFVDNTAEIEQLQEQIEDYKDRESMTGCSYAPEIEETRALIEDLENEQERIPEIFQFYIVSDNGAEILQEINEIVFYNNALDVYLWGVTHWGTSWDYVLTDIPCNCGYEILNN